MPEAIITKATVFEDGSSSYMARVVGQAGVNITIASITSIACEVFSLDDGASVGTPAVVVATSVFDTLQTDARWTEDDYGYNFRFDMPASVISDGGNRYRVEFMFVPVTGQQFPILFEVSTINLMGS